MKALGKMGYFQQREEWKVTDILMNPMILMMVLPLLIITVLPKMMNDPEAKKEMEQMQQNMNMQNQVILTKILRDSSDLLRENHRGELKGKIE